MKEHVQALNSALRRRKGDSSIQDNITSYICFKKKIKKENKRLISTLKQIDDNKFIIMSPTLLEYIVELWDKEIARKMLKKAE
ncbi:hypothetical protein Ddye_009945 [Dipteronia dyeriana]|uniref:Uncharacterized protein n=1 Tax=Dipteronia dyeriana TaxID=168575 RepID=A0AAE0CNC3_9ROSI|nr:hypothetical protein Ddye_009945 [Dipteronia dyeriana]